MVFLNQNEGIKFSPFSFGSVPRFFKLTIFCKSFRTCPTSTSSSIVSNETAKNRFVFSVKACFYDSKYIHKRFRILKSNSNKSSRGTKLRLKEKPELLPCSSFAAQTRMSTQTALVRTISLNLLTIVVARHVAFTTELDSSFTFDSCS